MNRMSVRVAALLGLFGTAALNATTSEFRSPLSFEYGGPIHMYLDRAHDLGYSCPEDQDCEPLWCEVAFEPWATGYGRSACSSFIDCNPCSDHVTRNRESLAALFFGAESFTPAQSFPNGIVPAGSNPTLNLSVTPQFTYSEKGVYFGGQAWYNLDDWCLPCWHVGTRVGIPFKVIKINNQTSVGTSQTTIGQVASEILLNTGTTIANPTLLYDFAFRLDFLSSLIRPNLPPTPSFPLVEYSTGTNTIRTSIAGQPVGYNAAEIAASGNKPAIFLIKRPDGTLPPRIPLANPAAPVIQTYGRQTSQITGQLPIDGSGAANNVLFFGDATVDYFDNVGTSPSEQATLFVVPHITDSGDNFVNNTLAIQNAIDQFLRGLDLSNGPIQTLAALGTNLTESECIVGQGDLRLEFLAGYVNQDDCWWNNWYIDGLLGVIVPTGKRIKDAEKVFLQTTGNNGHVEFELGVETAWRPTCWFGLQVKGYYNHVFKRTEFRAAPFVGATIRNIGPQIEVENSWNYGVLTVDMDFFHPCNPNLGATFGYELFTKGRDHISLCQSTAQTLLGATAPLDKTILEKQTNSLTNKLRGELFYRCHYFEIFAGASQIVSGRFSQKESEIHLGLMLYF